MKTPIRPVARTAQRLWAGLSVAMACLVVDPAQAAVTVSIESVGAAPGEQVVARVLLDDATQVAGGSFRLILPEFAKPGAAVTTVDTAGFLIASRVANGHIAVSFARANGLPAGPATVVSIPIRLGRDAPQGTFALQWEQARLYDDSPARVAIEPRPGRLTVLPSPPDRDHDGLPDPWENRLLGGLTQGAEDDADADGASNYAELLAGTNPGSAESVFRVGRFEAADAAGAPRVVIEWEGNPDRSYQIFWSEGPVQPGMTWHAVYRPVFQINGNRLRWTDDGTRTRTPPLRDRERYYRILSGSQR